jgi:adenylosuccinate lyase
MRQLWSETRKRHLLRKVWLALAEAQHEAGLVTAGQLADLRMHVNDVDIERTSAIEADIQHDLMAELQTYVEQCQSGGSVLHLGATSMDILDNVDALRLRSGLDILLETLRATVLSLADLIERWADTPTLAFTHLQPAEPTTIGYRLAQYGQDLLADEEAMARVRDNIKGKGLKGAVGTSSSFAAILTGTGITAAQLEADIMNRLGIDAFPAATQTYPRKQDWLILNALAGLGGTLYKFAFDLRLLQSPTVGEWSEPFGEMQVGSSAMPFKRNPIHSEKIDSLARQLAAMPRVAWDNAAHSLLERTLDDSANRRILLPEAFLITDELITTARSVIDGLVIDERAVTRNLDSYGAFAGTERLLMALSRAGADRQRMHERIRGHAMRAWKALKEGRTNKLPDDLCRDDELLLYLSAEEIRTHMDIAGYLGDAPERARSVARSLRN